MSTFTSNNPVDPLKLIQVAYKTRETDRNPFNYCTSSGEVLETLEEGCTHITIGNNGGNNSSKNLVIFPRSVTTNYRSKRGSGPHYPLDAICFLLERKDDSYTTYLQDVRRFGLTVISLPDKRELLEYLISPDEGNEYAAVDLNAELPVPLMLFPDSPEAMREQEQKATTISSSSSKRSKRVEDDQSVSSSEKLKSGEQTDSLASLSVQSSLVRPIETTETLFHCDKDFSLINSSFKNYLSSSLKTTATTINSKQEVKKPNSSLLDQISSMNSTSSNSSNVKVSSGKNTVWIIIVPAGTAALLTLHNVKDFLSDSKYIPVADARARGPKPSSIRLEHFGNQFEFIDNPARLALADWSRVLACFTLTSTWQFKGWKWETPLELFQHVLGFHVYFDDVALDSNVAGWNVTRLAISRNKRHLDATAVMAFWNRIDDNLKTRTSNYK